MNRLCSSLLTLTLAAAVLVGCESNQLEAPVALSLQTKNALDVLPADARFVGMVDMQAMKRNAQLNPLEHEIAEEMNGEMGARIQAFMDATGFDPRTDISRVYVAAPELGDDSAPSIVAYATFDRSRLEAYAEENFTDELLTSDYRGVTIYTSRDGGDHAMSFALANDEMMVASPDLGSLHAMLDRLNGSQGTLAADAAMVSRIEQVGGGDAWFVATKVDREMPTDAPEGNEIAQNVAAIGQAVQDVSVAINVKTDGLDGTVFLQTTPGSDTGDVAALARGVIAAMKAEPDLDADKLRALDRTKVQEAGDQVRIAFQVENAMLGDAH